MNDPTTPPSASRPIDSARRDGAFPPTRWTIVLAARSGGPEAAAALSEICRAYWRPIYSFLRRQGNGPHDAEDLTQGFFASLLERESLATVDEAKGRLRSFLLVALKRFAANMYERSRAQRRGGGALHVPIDTEHAEEHYTAEPATNVTPEHLFERQWALTLLDSVLASLRESYARDGRARVFDALKDRLSTDGDPQSLAHVAESLGMTEAATKVAVFRMRQRYKRLLQEQIAQTVESPSEVNDEIAHLFKVFSETS
jgi:RNA polymerase sigma factor (sigma-70 family)